MDGLKQGMNGRLAFRQYLKAPLSPNSTINCFNNSPSSSKKLWLFTTSVRWCMMYLKLNSFSSCRNKTSLKSFSVVNPEINAFNMGNWKISFSRQHCSWLRIRRDGLHSQWRWTVWQGLRTRCGASIHSNNLQVSTNLNNRGGIETTRSKFGSSTLKRSGLTDGFFGLEIDSVRVEVLKECFENREWDPQLNRYRYHSESK